MSNHKANTQLLLGFISVRNSSKAFCSTSYSSLRACVLFKEQCKSVETRQLLGSWYLGLQQSVVSREQAVHQH